MLFDAVVAKVDPTEPDRKVVGRRVLEVIAALGLQVDEASGEVIERPKPWPVPKQTNVRLRGRY